MSIDLGLNLKFMYNPIYISFSYKWVLGHYKAEARAPRCDGRRVGSRTSRASARRTRPYNTDMASLCGDCDTPKAIISSVAMPTVGSGSATPCHAGSPTLRATPGVRCLRRRRLYLGDKETLERVEGYWEKDSFLRKMNVRRVINKFKTQTKGYEPIVNHLESLWTQKCNFRVDWTQMTLAYELMDLHCIFLFIFHCEKMSLAICSISLFPCDGTHSSGFESLT